MWYKCVTSSWLFFFFCSVSWSSRAAFQESPSQWNAEGCVLVYLVRSSELQHTKLSRLVSTPVCFTDKWEELGLDELPSSIVLVFSEVSNSPPILPVVSFLNCHLYPCPPPPTHTHTHSHTAAGFLTATGSNDGVSVCVIVCHENGIWVNGWSNSGGEMQS